MLSQSLDDLGTTRGECLGRTRWSSPLDSTTYLYYFTSGCTPIITQSHVLPEHSTVTWPCHVVWLSNLPYYLYLDPIVRLDVRDQMCECVGNFFPSGALITLNSYFKWLSLYLFEYSLLVSTNPQNLSLDRNLSPNELGHSLMLGVNSSLCVIGVGFQLYG